MGTEPVIGIILKKDYSGIKNLSFIMTIEEYSNDLLNTYYK